MDPTIYTFGDPVLIVEALYALTTIMGGGWTDSGSAFGMGGNLLVAALIGLLGICIAAISTQQIRFDSLLVAFLIFAVVFSVETDVNVEDWYTGESHTVDDVPIGVAFVASAASSVSVSLTETIGTAMQSAEPERNTATLDQNGFMNPLKLLLAIRSLTLQELNEDGHKTLTAFYRYCIGRTEETSPGKWNMYQYLNTEDPIDYLQNGDEGDPPVDNWTTVWYDQNNRQGRAESCHFVANNIAGLHLYPLTFAELPSDELTGRIEEAFMRKMGTKTYGASYDVSDMHAAVNSVFGASEVGVNYMARLLLANAHNAGEAWKLAEYGGNKALYVATLTEAFEQKAFVAATEGSVFLQFMQPLMTFFQFLFFLMPPFVAFIAIAVPNSALKTVGYYLLYGTWAYSWLPIAEVINHYMQITTTNAFLDADLLSTETGWTSLQGFESLHNILLTNVVIGSNALAAAPIIMAALLMGTPMALSSIGSRLTAGGRVNSDVGAPKLGESSPIFKRESAAQATVGQTSGPGGQGLFGSKQQRLGAGTVKISSVLTSGVTSASTSAEQARIGAATTAQSTAQRMQSVLSSSEVESSQKAEVRAAQETALQSGLRDFYSQNQSTSLSASEEKDVMTAAGIRLGFGTGTENVDRGSFSADQEAALGHMMQNQESIVSSAAKSLSESSGIEQSAAQEFRRMSGAIDSSLQTAETYESYAKELSDTASRSAQLGISHEAAVVDIVQMAGAKGGGSVSDRALAYAASYGIVDDVSDRAGEIRRESGPIGLSGVKDNSEMSLATSVVSAMLDMSSSRPEAVMAFRDFASNEAGFMIPGVGDGLSSAASDTGGVAGRIEGRQQQLSSDAADQTSQVGASVASGRSQTEAAAGAIDAAAKDSTDIGALQDQWEEGALAATARSRAEGKAAARHAKDRLSAGRDEINSGVAAFVHDKLNGKTGYDEAAFDAVQSLPEGRSNKAAAEAADLVQSLQSSLTAQGDFDSDPVGTFETFLGAGFTPKAAASAAFSEAGFQLPSSRDFAVSAAVGGGVASGLGKAAEKRAQDAGGDAIGKKAQRFAKVGGLPVAAGSTLLGYRAEKRDALEAGEHSDARLQTQMIDAVREMDGQYGFQQFQQWQSSQGQPENAGELAGQIAEFYGLSHTGLSQDIALQGELMSGAKQTYGDVAYDQFRSYLQDQPTVENSEELANHIGMFFEGQGGVSGPAPTLSTGSENVERLRDQVER